MINIIEGVFFFLVGLSLAIRVIAALYRPLDLWYRIGTTWKYAVRGLLVWPVITILLFIFLSGSAYTGFVGGFCFFSAYFLLSRTVLRFLLRRLMMRYRRPRVIE